MIKKLIVLVVVVVILALMLMMKNKSAEKAGEEKVSFSEGDKSSLQSFQIKSGSDSTQLFLKNGVWVTDKNDFPADTGKINKVIDAIYKLKETEVVSSNPDRAGEYGLDEVARKSVSLDGPSSSKTIHIGKMASVDYNSTYWKKEGSDDVYRTSGNFSSALFAKTSDWLLKKLFTFKTDDVTSFSVSWKDSTGAQTYFSIVKNGNEWETDQPERGKGKAVVATMASRLGDLEFDGFPTPEDSLDHSIPPTMEIRGKLSSGLDFVLVGQRHKGNFFAKHPDRDDIVKLNEWRLSLFEKPWSEVFEPFPPDTSKTDSAAPAPVQPLSIN